jgi:hypothetical protein
MTPFARPRSLLLSALLAAFQAPNVNAEALDSAPRPTVVPPTSELRGRIFFTAAERRALEKPPTPPAPVSPPPPPAPPAAPPHPGRFDGALWREGRVVTLWLDGNATPATAQPAIRIANGIPTATIAGRRENLFPGQRWSPQGGSPP